MRASEKGFTLIETLLALGLMLMVLSTVIVTHAALVEREANAFAFRVFHFLSLARDLAIAEDRDVSSVIDDTAMRLESDDIELAVLEIPDGLKLIQNRQVGFTGKGHTRVAGTVKVVSPKNTHRITVAVGTGRITLQ